MLQISSLGFRASAQPKLNRWYVTTMPKLWMTCVHSCLQSCPPCKMQRAHRESVCYHCVVTFPSILCDDIMSLNFHICTGERSWWWPRRFYQLFGMATSSGNSQVAINVSIINAAAEISHELIAVFLLSYIFLSHWACVSALPMYISWLTFFDFHSFCGRSGARVPVPPVTFFGKADPSLLEQEDVVATDDVSGAQSTRAVSCLLYLIVIGVAGIQLKSL